MMPKDMMQARRPRDAIATDPEEWAVLMVLAQGGDGAAYCSLLVGVTPYLRRRPRIPESAGLVDVAHLGG